jgi:hypothetical protein
MGYIEARPVVTGGDATASPPTLMVETTELRWRW